MYKRISYHNVEFTLDPNGKLTKMINDGVPKSITIPAVLPSGEKITAIGEEFCYGYYDDVVIDDSISRIDTNAFLFAHVNSVSWPSSCHSIPAGCFSSSHIKSVTNINNVTKIGSSAFKSSNIKSFAWPAKCKKIPPMCFCDSELYEITNIEEVDEIGFSAFAATPIISLEWPHNCKIIPKWCFHKSKIRSISGIDDVVKINYTSFLESHLEKIMWPSYCESSVYNVVRSMTTLEELDLSMSIIVNFDGDITSFGIKSVIFPYYITDDMLNKVVANE